MTMEDEGREITIPFSAAIEKCEDMVEYLNNLNSESTIPYDVYSNLFDDVAGIRNAIQDCRAASE